VGEKQIEERMKHEGSFAAGGAIVAWEGEETIEEQRRARPREGAGAGAVQRGTGGLHVRVDVDGEL